MNASNLIRRFTIRMRMIGAIPIVLFTLFMVGGAGIVGMRHLEEHSQEFSSHTFAQSESLSQLNREIGQLRRYEKDMVINHQNPDAVRKYQQLWQNANDAGLKLLANIKAKAEGQKDERVSAIVALTTALQGYAGAMAPAMRQLEAGSIDTVTAANTAVTPAREAFRTAEERVAELQKMLIQDAEMDAAQVQQAIGETMLLFYATVGLSVLLVVPLTLLNMKSICDPLDEACKVADRIAGGDLSQPVNCAGADEPAALMKALSRMQQSLAQMVSQVRASSDNIGTASVQIASGNRDLSQRTEQAASNLQQTASSMEELTGTVAQSAESARQANQLASSAAQVAARGGAVVSKVVTTMDEINNSSKKIADIIGVIDGIAFQTNILALNAAVEAARAGEQGRGFAVVASEVRSLAQRSAQAAKEIKGLIGDSVDKVDSGSRLVADAGKTMNEIVGSVQRVSDIIGEITAAAAEQSDGIGQVNTAVTQLDQMTQQNAALVEQSSAAAASLREQAERLSGVVGAFRLDSVPPSRLGASAEATPRPLPAPPRKPQVAAAPAPAAAPRAQPAPPPPSHDDWESF